MTYNLIHQSCESLQLSQGEQAMESVTFVTSVVLAANGVSAH